MEKPSFLNWIIGALTAIVTGVIVWWLTDVSKIWGAGSKDKDTTIVITAESTPKKPELLLGIDIKPQASSIGFGQQTGIQIIIYDLNNENKPIGNANVEIEVSDGFISEAPTYPKIKYNGISDQNGVLSITYEAPLPAQPISGKVDPKAILAIEWIKITAKATLMRETVTYTANQSNKIKVQ